MPAQSEVTPCHLLSQFVGDPGTLPISLFKLFNCNLLSCLHQIPQLINMLDYEVVLGLAQFVTEELPSERAESLQYNEKLTVRSGSADLGCATTEHLTFEVTSRRKGPLATKIG
jgi:hypothetical protein